jgi:hypothetical protein
MRRLNVLSELLSSEKLVPVHRLERSEKYPEWALDRLRGRLVQLRSNGSQGALTAMVPILREAQAKGEFIAWIRMTPSVPFPADLTRSGIDLQALAHIRVATLRESFRATSHLLRSDGFGLIVIDTNGDEEVSTGIQGRIVKLAQLHDAAVICLTPGGRRRSSLSSMVSLRMSASHERLGPNQFQVTLHADKDKRFGPGWTWKRLIDGTPGLY